MPDLMIIFLAAASVSVFMILLWFIQYRKAEADIVDLGWTLSLGFLAFIYSVFAEGDFKVRLLVASFACIWAARLGVHLWKRVKEPGEDGRYAALRQYWGERAETNFFIFFQAQALLALILSLSFIIPVSRSDAPDPAFLLLSCFWFALSIGGEYLSDKQLALWRNQAANRGKTCRAGLWNYSRHPNYFFEWLYWFSFVFLSFGAPFWFLTLIPPLIMLFLILKITGIPPTEERALKSRGDDYRDYQKTTSVFIPWFKKG